MNELKDSLLRDIQTGLHECWMEAKKSSINVQINAISGTDATSGVLRNRKRKALTEEASRDFEACWSHVANGVAQQYDFFHLISLFCDHKSGNTLNLLPWFFSERHTHSILKFASFWQPAQGSDLFQSNLGLGVFWVPFFSIKCPFFNFIIEVLNLSSIDVMKL
jgi:hypothetical protein